MILAIPVLMVSIYKLFFSDPNNVSAFYLFIWLTFLWLGWTMLFILYYAWAAELTADYHERSRVTGWRSSIGLASAKEGR